MIFLPKVIYSGRSPVSGQIRVVESGGVRRLIVDGFVQSVSLNLPSLNSKVWSHLIRPPFPLGPNPSVLILGLGGGTTAHLASQKLKPKSITVVELDPLIVKVAKEFFDLRSIKDLTIVQDEAGRFLEKSNIKPLDLIVVDLYLGGRFFEKGDGLEFYRKIRRNLSRGGTVSINRIFKRPQVDERQRYLNLLEKIFAKVIEQELPGASSSRNYLYFCQK